MAAYTHWHITPVFSTVMAAEDAWDTVIEELGSNGDANGDAAAAKRAGDGGNKERDAHTAPSAPDSAGDTQAQDLAELLVCFGGENRYGNTDKDAPVEEEDTRTRKAVASEYNAAAAEREKRAAEASKRALSRDATRRRHASDGKFGTKVTPRDWGVLVGTIPEVLVRMEDLRRIAEAGRESRVDAGWPGKVCAAISSALPDVARMVAFYDFVRRVPRSALADRVLCTAVSSAYATWANTYDIGQIDAINASNKTAMVVYCLERAEKLVADVYDNHLMEPGSCAVDCALAFAFLTLARALASQTDRNDKAASADKAPPVELGTIIEAAENAAGIIARGFVQTRSGMLVPAKRK